MKFGAGITTEIDAFEWEARALRMSLLIGLLVKEKRMYAEDVLYGLNPYEIGLMV